MQRDRELERKKDLVHIPHLDVPDRRGADGGDDPVDGAGAFAADDVWSCRADLFDGLYGGASVQRHGAGAMGAIDPSKVKPSGGRALPPELRAEMEAHLGADFSGVRVHVDDGATDALGANAYTVGSDVVFNASTWSPDTDQGRALIAHELTHVVQQSRGAVAGTDIGGGVSVSDPSDAFEREADASAASFGAGQSVSVGSVAGGTSGTSSVQRLAVQRDESSEEEEERRRREAKAQGTPEHPDGAANTATPAMKDDESPEAYAKRITAVADPEKDAREANEQAEQREDLDKVLNAPETPAPDRSAEVHKDGDTGPKVDPASQAFNAALDDQRRDDDNRAAREEAKQQCPTELKQLEAAETAANKSGIDADASTRKKMVVEGTGPFATSGSVNSAGRFTGAGIPETIEKLGGASDDVDRDVRKNKIDQQTAQATAEALNECLDKGGAPQPPVVDKSCATEKAEVRDGQAQVDKANADVKAAERKETRTAVIAPIRDTAACFAAIGGGTAAAGPVGTVAGGAACTASIMNSAEKIQIAEIDAEKERQKRAEDLAALSRAKARLDACQSPGNGGEK